MALVKHLNVLRSLNYCNITSNINTLEVTKTNAGYARTVLFGRKQYRSNIILSLDNPVGKNIVISSSGTHLRKDLAEKEAIKSVIICLKNFIAVDVNNNDVYKKIIHDHLGPDDGFSKFKPECLIKELPFFQQDCTSYKTDYGTRKDNFDNSVNRNCLFTSGQSSLHKYYNNVAVNSQTRHFSNQSLPDGFLSSSGPVGVKQKDATSAFKEDISSTFNSGLSGVDFENPETLGFSTSSPKNILGNIYENVRRNLNREESLKSHKNALNSQKLWTHELEVLWPERAVFTGIAASKKDAGQKAAISCIQWLLKLGKIDKKGHLKLDKEVFIQKSKQPLAEIKISKAFVDEADNLIEYYFEMGLREKLKTQAAAWEENDLELFPDFMTDEAESTSNLPEKFLVRRNNELYGRLQERSFSRIKNDLPISKFRDKVVNVIKDNQVVVIKGETGCGKSTQVPQIIIDEYTKNMKATDCNIVVTQPRRISATSLAERIAFERHEMLGDVVGYTVRLKSAKPRWSQGCILFCTTGIMLRKMLSNPDMTGISHLIIDEAHERDLSTDLLLLLTKRAIAKNPDIKVIIMSATINPELFQNYFENTASLHIPGFTHPVASYFLDKDIARITNLSEEQANSDFPKVDTKAVARMVQWIHSRRPAGAILVFLPGWAEINRLNNELSHNSQLLVLPVHSRLSHDDQRKIFTRPPPGIRKVVLATNIAETSITIDDVNYVVDSGAHKEQRLHKDTGTLCLDNQWISQASAKQRRGRAGRIGPGECYHLYTKEKFDSLIEFPIPEVHRIRLETSVLNAKVYSGNDKAADFLKQLPEPPSNEMIKDAVTKLQWVGALDDDEYLTPLGSRIAVFTTHPLISKALVHSYIFKCVNPMVSIGTILSSDVELFPGTFGDKTVVRKGKLEFSPSSDHLALAWMFHEWEDYKKCFSHYKASEFLSQFGASSEAFSLVSRLRHLVGEHLYQCGLLNRLNDFNNFSADCNKYSKNHELVKGVLLSGLSNVLCTRNWDIRKGIIKKQNVLLTESGQRATIPSESVNFKRSDYPTPFMTYFTEVRSVQQRSITIRETSLVSPLTLLLFQCATVNINKCTQTSSDLELQPNQVIVSLLQNKKKLNIVCDERAANTIIKLRRVLWSVVKYLVREEGHPQDSDLLNEVHAFHNKLLSLLDKILFEQWASIDNANNELLQNKK